MKIAQVISAGGPTTRAAAEAALNGTDADRQASLTSGQFSAAETDNRILVAQVINAGGPEVKAAGRIALAGPRSAIRHFLP